MSPHVEKILVYIAIAAFFGGWAIVQLRSGETYLKVVGRFTRQQSPPVFWAICAVKLFFALVCALEAVKLLTHR